MLLTNLSILWFTNTTGSSMRLYKEARHWGAELPDSGVPTGIAVFPGNNTIRGIAEKHADPGQVRPHHRCRVGNKGPAVGSWPPPWPRVHDQDAHPDETITPSRASSERSRGAGAGCSATAEGGQDVVRVAVEVLAGILSCLHVILAEEWEHHRYAVRESCRRHGP
jgi:hypothetical protein